jgi:hypothetical protein
MQNESNILQIYAKLFSYIGKLFRIYLSVIFKTKLEYEIT